MTLSTAEPAFQEAVRSTIAALQRLASYELDPSLAKRMDDLGERKEFLDEPQHAELMALVAFAQQRTTDKLQAKVALDRWRALVPALVESN